MTGEPPELFVRTVDAGDVCTVELVGEIDLSTSTRASVEFELILSRQVLPAAIHVDLLGVTFMDSMGIAILIKARRQATAAGCRFSVTSMSPVIANVLEMSGLRPLLTGSSDPPA